MTKIKFLENKHGVFSVMGMRGSGKTYFTAQIIDELINKVDKVFYIDVVGVYDDYLKNKLTAEVDKLPQKDVIFKTIDKMMNYNKKVINFDISMLSRSDMVLFVDYLSEYLLRFKDKSLKVALICDEVGEYAEQERGYYSQMFETLVRIGRNKKISYVFMITQRPQKVNKHILALSDYYIIFKMIHNLDLEAVRNVLGFSSYEYQEVAENLRVQKVGNKILYDGLNLFWINENNELKNKKNEVKDEEIKPKKEQIKKPEKSEHIKKVYKKIDKEKLPEMINYYLANKRSVKSVVDKYGVNKNTFKYYLIKKGIYNKKS